jgi:hypothetical protein
VAGILSLGCLLMVGVALFLSSVSAKSDLKKSKGCSPSFLRGGFPIELLKIPFLGGAFRQQKSLNLRGNQARFSFAKGARRYAEP